MPLMVKNGNVLGHIIAKKGIKVDKAKVDFITNLPPLQLVNDAGSFLGHADFCKRFT